MCRKVGLLFATTAVFASQAYSQVQSVKEYPSRLIREEQELTVNGVRETWRLQWSAPPKSECEPSDASLTCPCMGFAYGEAGDLSLVRLRGDRKIDRLRLARFFSESLFASDEPRAMVQRWAPDYKRDFKLGIREDFPRLVATRRTVQIMRLADYDHDGSASEFYLQTSSEPCGKSVGVVIGVTKSNPKLHVFGFASHPDKPIYLEKREWEALRTASSAPVKVTALLCGDHGSGSELEDHLRWSAKGIDGIRREYSCTDDFERKGLVSEKPLSQAQE